MGLVLHVLQQHQAERHVANAIEAHQRDRARHRVDAAAARKVGAVDHPQQLVGQGKLFMGHAVHGALAVSLLHQGFAHQQLGHHQATGKQVHGGRRRCAGHRLGRHIADSAAHGHVARLAHPGRNAKVHHPGTPAAIHQNIGGLEVAVNHPLGMGHGNGVQHIHHQGHGFAHR